MILRNGVDITEISRIEQAMQNPRFLTRWFSVGEQQDFAARGNAPQTVAAHFAAKEAFAKAMGTGLRGFSLQEIGITYDEMGAPAFALSGKAAEAAAGWQLALSLSHDGGVAIAFVTAWKE